MFFQQKKQKYTEKSQKLFHLLLPLYMWIGEVHIVKQIE